MYRAAVLMLSTLSAGCQCQDYHVVDFQKTHPSYQVIPDPNPGSTMTRPRLPSTTPTLVPRFQHPTTQEPGSAPSPEPDACADDVATLDTATPDSPYATPALLPGTCPSSAVATWRSDALSTDAGDAQGATGWLDVPKPGVYDLYGPRFATVEADQVGFLRVPTISRPGGRPVHANCGTDWIVRDTTSAPAGTLVYLGTFALDAGPNPVQLRHACTLPPDGACRSERELVQPSTCGTPGLAPVTLDGASLCVIPAR